MHTLTALQREEHHEKTCNGRHRHHMRHRLRRGGVRLPAERQGGSRIRTAKLWLADLVPSDAVRSVRDVYGEQVGTPIFEGEVVTSKRFSQGERQIDVPAGLSVLSIPVKDVQAIGGSIAPGQHVDVYATGAAETELLASDVAVVSSSNDSEAGLGGGSISWVALAVEPRSVQELIAASQKTELYLVLPGDEQGGASDEA